MCSRPSHSTRSSAHTRRSAHEMDGPPAGLSSYLIAREDVDGGVDTVSQEHAIHLTQATVSQELGAVTAALKEEKAKSCALEEENKALRGQVVTVLSYLDQVMPMEGGGDTAATKNTEPAEPAEPAEPLGRHDQIGASKQGIKARRRATWQWANGHGLWPFYAGPSGGGRRGGAVGRGPSGGGRPAGSRRRTCPCRRRSSRRSRRPRCSEPFVAGVLRVSPHSCGRDSQQG